MLFRSRMLQIIGGPSFVLILRALPVWAMNGLAATGKMLPALGMSMLLKFMYKKELLPFFVLGFAVAAYTGLTDLLMFACIGVCLAFILIKLGFSREEKGVE